MDNMDNIEKNTVKVEPKNRFKTLKKVRDIIISPKNIRKDLEIYSKESKRYIRKLKSLILFVMVVILSIQLYTTLINILNKSVSDKTFPELIIKNGDIDIDRQFEALNNKKKEQEIIQKALNDINNVSQDKQKEINKDKKEDKEKKDSKKSEDTKLDEILEGEVDKRQIIDNSNNLKYVYIRKISEDNSKLLEKNNISLKTLDDLYKKIYIEESNSDLSKISINEKISKIIYKKQSEKLNKQLKDNTNNVNLVIQKEVINVFFPYSNMPYSLDAKTLSEIGRHGAKNYTQNIITKEMVIAGFNSNTIKIMTIFIFMILLYVFMYLILTIYLWIAKLFGEIVLKVLVVFKIFNLNTINIKNILTYSLTLPLMFLCINLSSNVIYAVIPTKEILNVSRYSIYTSMIIYVIYIILFAMIHKYIPLTKEDEEYIKEKNNKLNKY